MARSESLPIVKTAVFASLGFFLSSQADATVVISLQRTHDMHCAGGLCAPTGKNGVLNVADLAAMLATGDVKVSSGDKARDIDVAAALSWTSASRLTLDAYSTISFERPVVVAGSGALTIATSDGGKTGGYYFSGKGHIEFWDATSDLVINAVQCTPVADISSLANDVRADPAGCFALAKSYDAGHDGTYSSAPVATVFNGKFDGLGNSVSNVSINDPSQALNTADGFFAQTGAGAVISNIALLQLVDKGGTFGWLGGLVANNFGRIEHVQVSGKVIANSNTELIGGVVAANNGSISDAHFVGKVSGVETMGGVVGWNYKNSTVTGSSAAGEIDHLFTGLTDIFIGGLVGANVGKVTTSRSSVTVTGYAPQASLGGLVGGNGGVISKSYATGAITLKRQFGQIGGLVGDNAAVIVECFATGAVTASDSIAAGGLVGENAFGGVKNSYALGSVTGGSGGYTGGLVGDNGSFEPGIAISSYSIGAVHSGSQITTGGLVGYDVVETSGVQLSYWDLDTSDIPDPSRGAETNRTTQELRGYQMFRSKVVCRQDLGKIFGRNLPVSTMAILI